MKRVKVKEGIRDIIYIPDKIISEKLQGEVVINEVKFPKSLGEEHPFSFEQAEGVYKKFGFSTSAVDKHVDFIAGTDFQVHCKDDQISEDIIRMWIEDSNFKIIIRDWLREALAKGNGFMEIDNENQIRVLNANNIFIERNRKGEVLGYNQYFGKIDKNFNLNKINNFNPNQIIHLPINKIGDSAYGYGIIYPALTHINYLLQNEKDMHLVVSRKAGTPYHIKVGTPEEPARPGDLSAMGGKLEYLRCFQEWVTDHRVDIKSVDFGNLGEKFAGILDHDMSMLIYDFQVPEVIMGKGNIPEGIAKDQKDTFMRRIKSIQTIIERIVEERIFKVVLANNGRQAKVEFEWNMASESDINDKLDRLQRMMATLGISPQLKASLEIEVAKLLGIDIDILPSVEDVTARAEEDRINMQTQLGNTKTKTPDKERKKEESEKQPKIPIAQCIHIHESLDMFNDKPLIEFIGFNYKDYLKSINKEITKDDFEKLNASLQKDMTYEKAIELGLLKEEDIKKLKIILKNGFKDGKSISDISNDIKENIDLKDRYTLTEDGDKKLRLTKEERPIAIARTETLRLANLGLIEDYKEAGYEKVSWLASISERTCNECMGLNGQIFTLNEYTDVRNSIHPYCRCSSLPVSKDITG